MTKRYIYDALYGAIYLPEHIWNIIPSPELQRLREVRLCNINSFCLTGGANINRYEHAIGTCYLAYICLDTWPETSYLKKEEIKIFLRAALLHDILGGAFGHSIEYIESPHGFEHERPFGYVFNDKEGPYKYKLATLDPIFFGMTGELISIIPEKELRIIDEYISGKGRLGVLLNSNMDLDNIDNVYRLAYHIGLTKSGEAPIKIAKSLHVENNKLILMKEALRFVEEWYDLRVKLYSLLLLNPEEFSAKCMLTEAIEHAKEKTGGVLNWSYVDYEILDKLLKLSAETANIITRLMKGDLYGCIGIYSTDKIDKITLFTNYIRKYELEHELSEKIRLNFPSRYKSATIALHGIIDINKTERKVCIQTDDGEMMNIGKTSRRLLIGVFLKNKKFNIYETLKDSYINKMKDEVFEYLSNILDDLNIKEIKQYDEINRIKQ